MIAKYIFSGVKYVVGTRKNRLSETVLLSAQNRRLNLFVYVNLHLFPTFTLFLDFLSVSMLHICSPLAKIS